MHPAKDIAICRYDLKYKAFGSDDKQYLKGMSDYRKGEPFNPIESDRWRLGYKLEAAKNMTFENYIGEYLPRG